MVLVLEVFMFAKRILAYVYLVAGMFCILYFALQLMLQILAIIFGLILIVQGVKMLALDRVAAVYARAYFKQSFKR